jgi:hypothetical protein
MHLTADADGGAPTGATAAQQAAKDAGAEATRAEEEAEVDEIDDAAHVSSQHPTHPVARPLPRTLVIRVCSRCWLDGGRRQLVSGLTQASHDPTQRQAQASRGQASLFRHTLSRRVLIHDF